MKADLRESGALEQDATTVWLLYHDKATVDKFKEERQAGSGAVMSLAAGNKYLAERIMPTFLKIDKNQNGGLGKLPFIVYSNYFTWMLADWAAVPEVRKSKQGAIERTEVIYYDQFKKVHADWRHNAFEDDLRRWHCLLPEDVAPKSEAPEESESNAPSPGSGSPAAQVDALPRSQHDLPTLEELYGQDKSGFTMDPDAEEYDDDPAF